MASAVLIPLALAIVSAPPLQASDPPTHCTSRERVVFSCQTSARKVISLCASRPPSRALSYRYGPLDQPELVYPTAAEDPREHFRGSTVMYSGGGGAWLAFDRGGFTYFIYTAIGREWQKEGVLVRKGDAQVADIRCAGAYTSEIGPELFEQSDIPAGADEFDVPPGQI